MELQLLPDEAILLRILVAEFARIWVLLRTLPNCGDYGPSANTATP